MVIMLIASMLTMTVDDVLNRVELFSVRGDGQSCGMLAERDRSTFRGWALDLKRTSEERGIYGLYNPDAPEQLVLFFADAETCTEVLGVLEARELIERKKSEAPQGSGSDEHPSPTGNPRDVSAADAQDDAEKLGLFPASSVWCACKIDSTPSLSCDQNGERREVAFAPIVPVRVFGPTFSAWSDGDKECRKRGLSFSGRRCADRISPLFRRMVADLYNLAPQMVRSSYLDRDLRAPLPATCEQNERGGTLRPASAHAGAIARAYLYMHTTYPEHVPLEPSLVNVLERWHRENPPSKPECARGRAITAVQGNTNPLLDAACTSRP